MPMLIPRPTSKRFLQTNWLHRWLNTPSARTGLALAHAHHPAMVRYASIQRKHQPPIVPLPFSTVACPQDFVVSYGAFPSENDISEDA